MMTETPETRDSLLVAIRDPANESAWREFSEIYRPMVFRIARRMGLQNSDAEDVAQQVMLSVSGSIGNWTKDERKGTFRSWLTVVAKNAIRNAMTRVPPDRAVGGESGAICFESIRAPGSELDALFENEIERAVFRHAAIRTQTEFATQTWQAFWVTSVDGISIDEASQRLAISRGAIYAARSRVMRRLQQVASELLREHEST